MEKLNVFITIDTEVWSLYDDVMKNVESALWGMTDNGCFGLEYQVNTFKDYGLKANFFVEPLFSLASGNEPLERAIRLINDNGHDVQLHIHTEWLNRLDFRILENGATGDNIKDFSLEDQSRLIEYSMGILKECGTTNTINAFRAGNYGANISTLAALKQNNILYDTSYNYCYLDFECDMSEFGKRNHPFLYDGICIVPVTHFNDYPGHQRHVQIMAISYAEMRNVLLKAWKAGWPSVVIVAHSFEMVQRMYKEMPSHRVDNIVTKRYQNLCKFLSENRDKFNTRLFTETNPDSIVTDHRSGEINQSLFYFLGRNIEQIRRRLP